LSLDCVLRGAEEDLDPKMQLYPFEKQFDLPPAPIEVGVGAGVQRVDRIFQIDAKRFLGIERTGDPNEGLGQVGVHAPVAYRVRIGQGVAGYTDADARVIGLGRMRAQARFDVAQVFAVGKMRERHGQVLIEAGERLDFVFASVTRQAATKRRQWHMLHDLRVHQLAPGHPCPSRVSSSQNGKCQGGVQIETRIKHDLLLPYQSVAADQSFNVGTLLI